MSRNSSVRPLPAPLSSIPPMSSIPPGPGTSSGTRAMRAAVIVKAHRPLVGGEALVTILCEAFTTLFLQEDPSFDVETFRRLCQGDNLKSPPKAKRRRSA